jgi:hypothetical protein
MIYVEAISSGEQTVRLSLCHEDVEALMHALERADIADDPSRTIIASYEPAADPIVAQMRLLYATFIAVNVALNTEQER